MNEDIDDTDQMTLSPFCQCLIGQSLSLSLKLDPKKKKKLQRLMERAGKSIRLIIVLEKFFKPQTRIIKART